MIIDKAQSEEGFFCLDKETYEALANAEPYWIHKEVQCKDCNSPIQLTEATVIGEYYDGRLIVKCPTCKHVGEYEDIPGEDNA